MTATMMLGHAMTTYCLVGCLYVIPSMHNTLREWPALLKLAALARFMRNIMITLLCLFPFFLLLQGAVHNETVYFCQPCA